MTKKELTKLIKEILSEDNKITPEFLELKKHQKIIQDEQKYLGDLAEKLNVDLKLVGNFNQSLNALMDAIFKAQK